MSTGPHQSSERPKDVRVKIDVAPHPLSRISAFMTQYAAPLHDLPAPELHALLRSDATAPLQRDETVRRAVRDMLRHGGYKPTGRGKPASEYLVRAVEEGALDSINAAVDACNIVSLHSGLPISVIDLDLATPPFRISPGAAGERYVFNRSGQEIDIAGLLCLFDAAGPCANAVRDAQRTKTQPGTIRTLSVIWGVAGFEERLAQADAWYRELLTRLGAVTEQAQLSPLT
jgi:DNA/RNA-binding domain of Phe-tRNA-synthetase-like protein